MQLNYRDFQRQSTGFFSSETEAEVLARMNTWLVEQKVQALNVETLLEGGGSYSVIFKGFRVWYNQG